MGGRRSGIRSLSVTLERFQVARAGCKGRVQGWGIPWTTWGPLPILPAPAARVLAPGAAIDTARAPLTEPHWPSPIGRAPLGEPPRATPWVQAVSFPSHRKASAFDKASRLYRHTSAVLWRGDENLR